MRYYDIAVGDMLSEWPRPVFHVTVVSCYYMVSYFWLFVLRFSVIIVICADVQS